MSLPRSQMITFVIFCSYRCTCLWIWLLVLHGWQIEFIRTILLQLLLLLLMRRWNGQIWINLFVLVSWITKCCIGSQNHNRWLSCCTLCCCCIYLGLNTLCILLLIVNLTRYILKLVSMHLLMLYVFGRAILVSIHIFERMVHNLDLLDCLLSTTTAFAILGIVFKKRNCILLLDFKSSSVGVLLTMFLLLGTSYRASP